MTTGNNKITDRINDPNSVSAELTTGIPVDGTVDPTGEYPRRFNWFQSSTSAVGRGVKVNDLWIGGSSLGTNFDVPVGTTSIFPFNNANETPSGHSFEIDDTPGNERILIKHHTGAGVELKQDGSVAVVSRTHQVQVVGADHELIVSGQGNITYDGDLNLTVNGNYNLEVGGTMNVNVGANHNHSVHGTYITETGDTHQTIVRGNKDTKVLGDRLDYTSNEHKVVAKKDLRLMAGNDLIANTTRGIRFTAEQHITTAAGQNTIISAPDIRVIGQKGKIGGEKFHYFGSVYTGGSDAQGKETVFHGNLVGRALEAWTAKYAKFSEEAHSAHISNFATKADRADDAYRADWATAADRATTAPDGPAPTGSKPNTNDYNEWTGNTKHDGTDLMGTSTRPVYQFEWGWEAKNNHVVFASVDDFGQTWTQKDPDAGALMASGWPESTVAHDPLYDYHAITDDWWEVWNKVSPYAVRKVYIDQDDDIEDKIAKTDAYTFYFNWTPTTAEIRSKLRTMDGANDTATSPEGQTDGAKCIDSLLNENRLNPLYSLPAPPAPFEVKRSGTSVPQPRFGYTLLGNPVERASKAHTPKNVGATQRTIVADPIYNPDNQTTPINSGTRLSKSSTLSKFFGAPGSKTSLESVALLEDRQNLARQYYLHAWFMEGVASAKEFKNYRLQVTEAYYNPANGIREQYNGRNEPAVNYYWREPYLKSDGGSCQTSIVKGAPYINELKHSGRACVYTLYNSRGKVDYSATFDLALYVRDTFFFDQLSLDYDITRPDGVMSQQLIVVMPVVAPDFKVVFEQKVCTYFNRKLLSGSDLMEITD